MLPESMTDAVVAFLLVVVLQLAGSARAAGAAGASSPGVERVNSFQQRAQQGGFTLSVVHLNDFHARFEAVSPEFTSCDPSLVNTCVPYPCPKDNEEICVGGIARVSTAIRTLKNKWPNSIVLNGGDNFQGSLYYFVHRHSIMSFYVNMLQYDAISLGNHEFDQGVDNVKAFIRRLTVPVVAANIDASDDPQFAALIQPSIVLKRGGREIGVIGYLLNNTADISQTGKVRFGNEWQAVNEEAARLKRQGVDIIVCVSHDGLAGDIEVAKRAPDVDLIVGGHSHTFLFSGPPPTDDLVRGDYPVVVVTQESGRKVLVVQAFAGTKYLGHILVDFDENGEVVGWEGQPMLLDKSVRQDRRIQKSLHVLWKPKVERLGSQVVGFLDGKLSQDDFQCITGECNIGDVVADAFVDHTRRDGSSHPATIGMVVGWSMVANLERGNVTFEDVFNVLPYEYSVDTFEILGKDLLAVMESSAAGEGLFQWSGVVMHVDFHSAAGSRISNVSVRTDLAQGPSKYPPLDPGRLYRAAAQSVALSGGYSNPELARSLRNRVRGSMDHRVLATYLSEHPNLSLDGGSRVTVTGQPHPRKYSGLPISYNNSINEMPHGFR